MHFRICMPVAQTRDPEPGVQRSADVAYDRDAADQGAGPWRDVCPGTALGQEIGKEARIIGPK